jgi:hypothetical protein
MRGMHSCNLTPHHEKQRGLTTAVHTGFPHSMNGFNVFAEKTLLASKVFPSASYSTHKSGDMAFRSRTWCPIATPHRLRGCVVVEKTPNGKFCRVKSLFSSTSTQEFSSIITVNKFSISTHQLERDSYERAQIYRRGTERTKRERAYDKNSDSEIRILLCNRGGLDRISRELLARGRLAGAWKPCCPPKAARRRAQSPALRLERDRPWSRLRTALSAR